MFYSTKTLETKSIKYYYIGICLKYFWMIFVVFFILLQEIQKHYYPRRYFKFIRESSRTYASMCKKENLCTNLIKKILFFYKTCLTFIFEILPILSHTERNFRGHWQSCISIGLEQDPTTASTQSSGLHGGHVL